MGAISLAQLGALLNPQHAARLQAIEQQALAHYQVHSALETQRHQARLVEMERELAHRLVAMHGQAMIETQQDLTRSIIKQLEDRSATRNEMAKMILAAAIQAKLGKVEHAQRLEEQYLGKLYDYLFSLLSSQQRQAAEDYIDQLYRETVQAGL